MPIGSEVKRPLFAKALAAVRGCTFLIRVLPVVLLVACSTAPKPIPVPVCPPPPPSKLCSVLTWIANNDTNWLERLFESKKFQADLGDADAIVKRECGTSVKEILAARRLMAKEPK